ncbi:MAG: DUF5668 domain-containing protein [Mucilaginibacter sp.]
MSDDIKYTTDNRRGRSVAGAILLVVGLLLLVKQFDFFFFPGWITDWPMILIVLGLYIGAKHNFRKSSWAILMTVGIAFLLDDALPGNIHVAWPIIVIGFGLWMILRRNTKTKFNKWDQYSYYREDKWDWQGYKNPAEPVVDYTVPPTESSSTPPPPSVEENSYTHRNEADYLDAVSVFGGVKKTILSKDFKGGDIVNIFGGVELDFTQADINGSVSIDITQFFGGIKIIVPANWKVVSDLAAVFASVDDKRMRTAALNAESDKVLVLKGVSFFAGVDIRSY